MWKTVLLLCIKSEYNINKQNHAQSSEFEIRERERELNRTPRILIHLNFHLKHRFSGAFLLVP